jgi:hypothetical protein
VVITIALIVKLKTNAEKQQEMLAYERRKEKINLQKAYVN